MPSHPYLHLSIPHLFPFTIRPDGILQLQGKTRLCLADDKNLGGGETESIKIQRVTNHQRFHQMFRQWKVPKGHTQNEEVKVKDSE